MRDKYSISRFLTGYQLPMHIAMAVMLVLFRVIFIYCFLSDFEQIYSYSSSQLMSDLSKAVLKGLRFDGMILAYSMILQLFLALLFSISKWSTKWYVACSKILQFVCFIFILAIVNLDIPYFDYFGEHPTKTVTDWLFFGNTYSMMFQDLSYVLYFLLFISCVLVFALLNRVFTHFTLQSRVLYLLEHPLIRTVCISFIVFVSILGTRGQLSLTKLNTNAAYFTDHHLVSQLTLGPLYSFVDQLFAPSQESNLEKLMPLDAAVEQVCKQLGIPNNAPLALTPFSRNIEVTDYMRIAGTNSLHNYNVVFVFMESMSSGFLQRMENEKVVTPFLDSLSQVSLYFDRVYSTGIHTNIGVASTYTGWLSVLNQHMMPRQPRQFDGIARILSDKGYSTSFFISHHANYDNMDAFLLNSHVDTIFSQLHYNKDARVNSFGVSDDYLLPFAVKELSKSQTQPFFTSILTVSNHPPYLMPNSFRVFDNEIFSAAHYADYNLKMFLEAAQKEPWYNNTIFVFFGDHGKLISKDRYDMQLDLNHIPLIIFSPGITNHQTISTVGGQIDIAPTILQLLGETYIDNSLGHSLLSRNSVPYAVFSTSTYIACVSDSLLYTINPRNSEEKLYNLHNTSSENILSQHTTEAEEMKNYALSRVMVSSHYYNIEP